MHRDEKFPAQQHEIFYIEGKNPIAHCSGVCVCVLQSCYSKREIMEYLIRLRSRFCACPRWKFTATTTQRRVTAP